jgi:hypothetical protein
MDDGVVLEVFDNGEVYNIVQEVTAKKLARRGPRGVPITGKTRDWSLVARR